jgi:hypothetical protein
MTFVSPYADIPEPVYCRVTNNKGVDTTRHFSYYAFAGGDGTLRWKHEVSRTSFHEGCLFGSMYMSEEKRANIRSQPLNRVNGPEDRLLYSGRRLLLLANAHSIV